MASKSIKILTGQANGNNSLKKTQIYQMIKEVKQEKTPLNSGIPIPNKTKRSEDVIVVIAFSPWPKQGHNQEDSV
jgi:hypothetical protein